MRPRTAKVELDSYPRPPRGGRRASAACHAHRKIISIHALREEGDAAAALAGLLSAVFLSTPSARRATEPSDQPDGGQNISIHALREEGDGVRLHFGRGDNISIHALREEGDMLTLFAVADVAVFLSTPSARRATSPARSGERFHLAISIHALREEGDRELRSSEVSPANFYPRPPRGGRRLINVLDSSLEPISIHALREEGDAPVPSRGRGVTVFLSTPSARRATFGCGAVADQHTDFYPRPPRGGRPAGGCRRPWRKAISIHALREEGDGRWRL